MKVVKVIVLFVFVMCSVFTKAQTQQGVVKTRGKMVNGKHVAGQGLSGATITLQGRSRVLSQGNGMFSFPVQNKTFMVQGVQKQGYQLVDADATRKTYQYSPNTFYLVMDTPDQQVADKLAAERKIRRTLQRQLQQREDELEEMKEQSKLTQEEYQKKLQQLYNDQQNNEKLIADMAKEYAAMDYDQMDELNRQISDAIQNGELTRADSLLRSKGDIRIRIGQLHKQQEANKAVKADLEKSEALAKKRMSELADDCYHMHDIFKINHQNDSAAYYLELCANLDTTNVEWQIWAGHFLLEYMTEYTKAITYYDRAIRAVLFQPEGGYYDRWLATSYCSIGYSYWAIDKNKYGEKAYDYYKKALGVFRKKKTHEETSIKEPEEDDEWITVEVDSVFEDTGQSLYVVDNDTLDYYNFCLDVELVRAICNNIGVYYQEKRKYDKAIECYQATLDICRDGILDSPADTAVIYNNLGYLYGIQEEYDMAMDYYTTVVNLFQDGHIESNDLLATTFRNMSRLYNQKEEYNKALEYAEKSLEIYKDLYGDDHVQVVAGLLVVASQYYHLNEYKKAIDFYLKAFIYEDKFSTLFNSPSIYWELADCYEEQGMLEKSIEFQKKALNCYISLWGENTFLVAQRHFILGSALLNLQDNHEALIHFTKAVEIAKACNDDDYTEKDRKSLIAMCYHGIAQYYYKNEDKQKYVETLEAELPYDLIVGEDKEGVAFDARYIAYYYAFNMQPHKAAKYFELALNIYKETSPDSLSLIEDLHEMMLFNRYKQAVEDKTVSAFLSNHFFTITPQEGDNPARQQGMIGEYVLLEFADWTIYSDKSLFEIKEESLDKSVDILVIKDSIIEKFHFKGKMGVIIGIKEVEDSEFTRISKIYEDWKKETF